MLVFVLVLFVNGRVVLYISSVLLFSCGMLMRCELGVSMVLCVILVLMYVRLVSLCKL